MNNIKNVELIDFNVFKIDLINDEFLSILLLINDQKIDVEFLKNEGNSYIYKFDDSIDVLGSNIKLYINHVLYDLDCSKAIDFLSFDDRYYYDGKLGAIYSKESTSFSLWAPLVKECYLLINDSIIKMNRLTNGVFNITLLGDYDGKLYRYRILINNKYIDVIDPYGYSGNANNEYSAVINLDKLDIDTFDYNLGKMNSPLDAIIYETNVRDMTIDSNTNIINKGKFLGLIEENKKTKANNHAGLDYICSLGITHLQLLPILDIATIDDLNPNKTYNWGYDPNHFFTLNGSYSLNADDPYSRMIEFKQLVSKYHKKGIRINLDVVYNHVYEAKTSLLNKITPNYYFRRDENNEFLDHSYCGNEIASERKMVRKLILDSLIFLTKTYHVDGFRFDLMGLIDLNTMKLIEKSLHEINKDIMIYGEGWNMFTKTSDDSPLATMEKASLMENISFFNDRYRNIVRGSGHKASLDEKGYLLGNISYKDGFKFAYVGSSFDITFPALFNNIYQSINYVECHDNATLFDVINTSLENEDCLRLVRKINKLLMFSFGISFIHAGQEIGLTKFNHHNTYNEGDRYNKFDYSLLDKRIDMVRSFISYIKARKQIEIFRCNNKNIIDNNVTFEDIDDILHIQIQDINKNKTIYHIYVNPTQVGYRINFSKSLKFFIPNGYKKDNINVSFNHFDISPEQVSIFEEEN